MGDRPREETRPSWPAWVEDWVWPYLSESMLWPVWIALLGHVVVVVAGMMLVAWRDGTPEAWIGLAVLGLASAALAIWELRIDGRPGGMSLSLLGTWLSSLALAESTGFL